MDKPGFTDFHMSNEKARSDLSYICISDWSISVLEQVPCFKRDSIQMGNV